MTKPEINREVAKKVLETVDRGLSCGLGEPVPGQMCVEAAVCYALGLPHSDDPKCVGYAVRQFKICLNDKSWSSPEARAKGLRRVAIAQLGSDSIDQRAFVEEVVLQTVRQILPIVLRAAGSMIPGHKEALELVSVSCESITAFSQAREIALKAKSAAYAAYAAYAAAYAADADADAAAYAADAAAAAAAAYAAAADADADDRKEKRDSILSIAAEIAVQALIKLGSKGCEWLDLCE